MSSDSRRRGDPSNDFEALYRRHYQAVRSFVRRRVAGEAVDEMVVDVFTVAWRRLDAVPPEPEARLWLLGVARRCVSQHRRSGIRRFRLLQRLEHERSSPDQSGPGADDPLAGRVADAMRKLRQRDAEVLRLVLWDGLSHVEASRVLGCSPNAVELRLRRARARLGNLLAPAPADDPLLERRFVTPIDQTGAFHVEH